MGRKEVRQDRTSWPFHFFRAGGTRGEGNSQLCMVRIWRLAGYFRGERKECSLQPLAKLLLLCPRGELAEPILARLGWRLTALASSSTTSECLSAAGCVSFEFIQEHMTESLWCALALWECFVPWAPPKLICCLLLFQISRAAVQDPVTAAASVHPAERRPCLQDKRDVH